MGGMLKKANEMKKEMKKVQNELKTLVVEETDKRNTVTVSLTGELDCVEIKFSDNVLASQSQADIQKALIEAYNKAAKKAKELASSKLCQEFFHRSDEVRLRGKDDAFCKLNIHGKTFFKSLTRSKTESILNAYSS